MFQDYIGSVTAAVLPVYHGLDEPNFGEGWFFFDTEPRPPEDRWKLFHPRCFVRWRDVFQTTQAPTVQRALEKSENQRVTKFIWVKVGSLSIRWSYYIAADTHHRIPVKYIMNKS